MAAGPGIRPRAAGSPWMAHRSGRNYPHLVAGRLGLDLVDVTCSGAKTAHLLTDRQNGVPPQADALDGSEEVITVTIGGNDVGYVPMLVAASLPSVLRRLPRVGPALRDLLDAGTRERALKGVGTALRAVGDAVRTRSPRARVLFVDYLTLLPPPGEPTRPLPVEFADLGRHVAARLEEETAAAAAETGCELVAAAAASTGHHPWSSDPWTVGAELPLPGRPMPFHPNLRGMEAVADLVVARLASTP